MDQVSQAVDQGVGFSGARSGKDKDRSLVVLRGLALSGIKVLEPGRLATDSLCFLRGH
jgi:hypothetical protein